MTTATAIRTVDLPSGDPIPVLGQGTWGTAEDARRRGDEIAALRLGVDLGMTLIDTADLLPRCQETGLPIMAYSPFDHGRMVDHPAHVRDNRAAYDIQLTESDLALLDRAFPPTSGPQPLEVL